MKNIAIIVPSLKGGGAERVVSNMTMNLSKDKYNIYLILFDSSGMKYPYMGKLIDLDIKANDNPFIKGVNFIKRYFRIKKIKNQYQIDTSISFLPGPSLLNILTKKNEKTIVSVRSYTSRKSNGIYSLINRFLMQKLYNYSDKVIGVSNLIKNNLVENFNIKEGKIETIYNPYDLKNIDTLSKKTIGDEYKLVFKEKVVITVGRLNSIKGHLYLIRAFRKIVDYDKNVQLVILGDGELKGCLQKLIDDLKLNNNVHLLGFKNNPYKYIEKSSVFILPSLSEGFPNTLAEAMACGIPVISTDCKSGPREILAPETDIKIQCKERELAEYGILIPVCDGKHYNHKDLLTKEEKIMADTILELLNDKELYDKYHKKGIERVQKFEINNIMEKWEGII